MGGVLDVGGWHADLLATHYSEGELSEGFMEVLTHSLIYFGTLLEMCAMPVL